METLGLVIFYFPFLALFTVEFQMPATIIACRTHLGQLFKRYQNTSGALKSWQPQRRLNGRGAECDKKPMNNYNSK